MATQRQEFSRKTRELALVRQQHVCASCGTPITGIGEGGRAEHAFGETAQAHHIKHAKLRGGNDLDNCVVICWACHYCVHEGGNYRFSTVSGAREDFPHYHGSSPSDDLGEVF